MSTPPPPRDHARAALVLIAALLMSILGFPGLDLVGGDRYADAQSRERVTERFALGFVAVAAADLNRWVREPTVRAFTPLQRPLRIAQSWGLYGAGPKRVTHLEIALDGRRIYRSQSPTDTWFASTLRYRRLRPMISGMCHDKNTRGPLLARWIAAHAAEDFPQGQDLELRCTVAPWHGDAPEKITWSEHHDLAALR